MIVLSVYMELVINKISAIAYLTLAVRIVIKVSFMNLFFLFSNYYYNNNYKTKITLWDFFQFKNCNNIKSGIDGFSSMSWSRKTKNFFQNLAGLIVIKLIVIKISEISKINFLKTVQRIFKIFFLNERCWSEEHF